MSRFHIKVSGQQIRRDRPNAIDLLNAWIVGYSGGFYDITEPDAALSETGVAARHNNDHVRTLVQLLTNGSASDLVFKTQADGQSDFTVDANNWYRRDIVTANGNNLPRKPMLFYPRGTFTPGGSSGLHLVMPIGTLGNPDGVPLLEYTTGLYGMKMLHEIGLSQSDINSLETSNPEVGLPVPTEPGSLIIRVSLQGISPSIPVIEYYVNGVFHPVAPGGSNHTPVDHSVGLNTSQFMMMFAMPCWATQKMFNITRLLTEDEIAQLHTAMVNTSEVYQ